MRHKIVEQDLSQIIAADLHWETLAGKTVFISGANGFLPAYIVETLLYLNEQKRHSSIKVIGLVRNKNKALKRLEFYQNRTDLELIEQDVSSPISLDLKIDFIIHAASQASPKYYGKDPAGTLLANTLGTYNLLELAKLHQVESFLYFSSSEVYGKVDPSCEQIREDNYGYLDPTLVRSCYAESKRMGENMCVSWFHQYNIPTKIVRPFHTYGPGLSLDDGRVYADFVADIVNNRDIIMKSDGSARRAFCYLADAVQGFLTILLKGENGQAYNLGNPQGEISILELAVKLVDLFPEKGLKVLRQPIQDNPDYIPSQISRNCPDISKLLALGWQPQTSIEEGFKRTIGSFL
ncbi:NAD-dependent epimerase/dehydratase family protein [Microcystis aeruginosa]|uniref:NAD-dependent epimerase/dehydratase family protein n=1 Tax=Microcystis aeruginosa TaxID=1126 RepID=UPI00232AC6BA|nr:NAD-dependent epimerase/dehydratase family protein [Microcystis aeruginosa]MDB9389594.1 NAD-dependent epimerase/dehydratase family protein [Microcystis aeruginosa CS-579]